MENYIITTIYFDGQFWAALIKKNADGVCYTGRYVFGSEPSNPEILHWMIYEFDKVPLLKTDGPVKIRFRKIVDRSEKSLTKSLDAFKESQKAFFEEKKTEKRKKNRESKQALWELKHQKAKEKKNH